MNIPEHTILIVDDTPINLDILNKLLAAEGYRTLTAESGEAALLSLQSAMPDLILMDMVMPGMNGLEVCKIIQASDPWREIPVIFITAVTGGEHIAKALAAGAVDYITKPFNKAEILARVRTHLRLYDALNELKRLNALALDANPLTGLPGNNTINKKLQSLIDHKHDVAVIYADLDNFKPFNDVYGYMKGDDALRMLAGVLIQAVGPSESRTLNFVGHIGGDDFVLILPTNEVESAAARIKEQFDNAVPLLYSPQDRENGGIRTTDRHGGERFFPILSLSMGGIRLSDNNYTHIQQIAADCAEVKKKSKQLAGTGLYMNQRKM